jgi:hypothetical protein
MQFDTELEAPSIDISFDTFDGVGTLPCATTSLKFQPTAAVALSMDGVARVAVFSSDTSPSSFSSSRAVCEAAVLDLCFRTVGDGRHCLFNRWHLQFSWHGCL